jgi:hypothetical protein
MPEVTDPDVVRLTLPPDGDIAPVLEVAVGVLARRRRLRDADVDAGRAAAAAAFAEVAGQAGGEAVAVEITMESDHLVVVVAAGDAEQTLTLPAAHPRPG